MIRFVGLICLMLPILCLGFISIVDGYFEFGWYDRLYFRQTPGKTVKILLGTACIAFSIYGVLFMMSYRVFNPWHIPLALLISILPLVILYTLDQLHLLPKRKGKLKRKRKNDESV